MKRHVLLTGEIGAGKSTALRETLALLGGVRPAGLQTYYPEPRGAALKTLYMRAWGDGQPGVRLGCAPGTDMDEVTRVFDTHGTALLAAARQAGGLIVIDEIGRLERDAGVYQQMLRDCLDADTPVLAVVRKLKAPWADWVRSHPAAALMEVTPQNRDDVPREAARFLREIMKRQA